MTEATTATSPQVERAVIPWSRPDGLPPLMPDTVVDPALLVPAVPVVLLNDQTGRAIELRLQLDTGCSHTVITMGAARALGLEGLTPDGAIEFPLKGEEGVRDVFSKRLPAVIAGRWNVEITARFVEASDGIFFGSGLLGRDILDAFRVTFDGPARTLELERGAS